MAITSAKHRANEKYNAKAYDEIKVRVPKGRKAEIQSFVEQSGQSVNSFINRLIDEAMSKGSGTAGKVSVSPPPVQDANGNSPFTTLTAPASPTDTDPSASVAAPDKFLNGQDVQTEMTAPASHADVATPDKFRNGQDVPSKQAAPATPDESKEGQTIPSLEQDKSLPYFPIHSWEDESTPEYERKLLGILKKRNIPVPTIAEFEAMSPDRQMEERIRLFEARDEAIQVLETFERKRENRQRF